MLFVRNCPLCKLLPDNRRSNKNSDPTIACVLAIKIDLNCCLVKDDALGGLIESF